MKRYLTEFIGTFFLVLTVFLTVTNGTQMAPLAIGCSLMIMVYMGGHISGGHYNPAVTLAAFLRGACAAGDVLPYWVAQLAGGIVASAAGAYLSQKPFVPRPGTEVMAAAVLNEVLFTFALALVVLNVATAKKTANNSYFGLAIGFTVVVGAFAGGGISGGAYNPAVGLGPIIYSAMTGGTNLGHFWLYIAGPLVGGALAAGVFKIQEAE